MSEQTIPFVLERAKKDGCNCPDWVIQCAHFGVGFAYIADRFALPPRMQIERLRPEDLRFCVYPPLTEFALLSEAQAAFHQAEARLLRGGDA